MRRLIAWRLPLLVAAAIVTFPSVANAKPLDWHREWASRKEATLDALRAKRVWTADDVELVTLTACDDLGIDHSWLVPTVRRIAWRESRFDTAAESRSSSARGLLQFLAPWGSEEKRTDGVWSVYRIVELYRDGGQQKIRQHWALTY